MPGRRRRLIVAEIDDAVETAQAGLNAPGAEVEAGNRRGPLLFSATP